MDEVSEAEYLSLREVWDDEDDILVIEIPQISAQEAGVQNTRFLRKYAKSAQVRKGRAPKTCSCCRKSIAAGLLRVDYAGIRGRIYWHTTCAPPLWFRG